MTGDLGKLLYAVWCEVMRAGTTDPLPWAELSPLERDAWRTAANRLRRGLADEVSAALYPEPGK